MVSIDDIPPSDCQSPDGMRRLVCAIFGERLSDLDLPELQVSPAGLKEALDSVLDSLGPRARYLMTLRFGLDDGLPRTFHEIADELNVTEDKVRQIESKTMSMLRAPERSGQVREYLEELIGS